MNSCCKYCFARVGNKRRLLILIGVQRVNRGTRNQKPDPKRRLLARIGCCAGCIFSPGLSVGRDFSIAVETDVHCHPIFHRFALPYPLGILPQARNICIPLRLDLRLRLICGDGVPS
jgi:hypothetical protein